MTQAPNPNVTLPAQQTPAPQAGMGKKKLTAIIAGTALATASLVGIPTAVISYELGANRAPIVIGPGNVVIGRDGAGATDSNYKRGGLDYITTNNVSHDYKGLSQVETGGIKVTFEKR